ncbi:hypothetical protein HDV06_002558 [Boothiomyces sp. JEL0866]|nr:hypothetical protein HDV06_002558 [Boothiomyces sp. JEL0866]
MTIDVDAQSAKYPMYLIDLINKVVSLMEISICISTIDTVCNGKSIKYFWFTSALCCLLMGGSAWAATLLFPIVDLIEYCILIPFEVMILIITYKKVGDAVKRIESKTLKVVEKKKVLDIIGRFITFFTLTLATVWTIIFSLMIINAFAGFAAITDFLTYGYLIRSFIHLISIVWGLRPEHPKFISHGKVSTQVQVEDESLELSKENASIAISIVDFSIIEIELQTPSTALVVDSIDTMGAARERLFGTNNSQILERMFQDISALEHFNFPINQTNSRI